MPYYSLDSIDPRWDRYYKGYYYEMLVQENLANNGITYIGNPIDLEDWKRVTNTDYDIRVKIDPSTWLRVECKLTLTRLFDSWLIRDWYSRNCDVIVTNNVFNVPLYGRNLLATKKKIALVDTYKLVPYITEIQSGDLNGKLIVNPLKLKVFS